MFAIKLSQRNNININGLSVSGLPSSLLVLWQYPKEVTAPRTSSPITEKYDSIHCCYMEHQQTPQVSEDELGWWWRQHDISTGCWRHLPQARCRSQTRRRRTWCHPARRSAPFRWVPAGNRREKTQNAFCFYGRHLDGGGQKKLLISDTKIITKTKLTSTLETIWRVEISEGGLLG